MAVREFDGVDDVIVCGTGAASQITFNAFTVGILVKLKTAGQGAFIYGGDTRFDIETYAETLYHVVQGNLVSIENTNSYVNSWVLIVLTKAAGSSIPRSHSYKYSTATWTHLSGSAAQVAGTTALQYFDLGRRRDVSLFLDARMAVVGLFPVNFTDAAIEAAGLHTSLQKWLDNGANALWPLNQASVATAVADATGGGANQTSITGTVVITTDDPPGFDFNLTTAKQAASPITLTSTSRAVKVAATGGVSSLGGTSTSRAVKVAPASGVGSAGLVSHATALKMAPAAGMSPVVVGSVFSRRQLSAQGGAGELGLTTSATPRKVAIVGGTCSLGAAATALQHKVAPVAGVSALALAPVGGGRKLATSQGLAVLSLTGSAVGRKTGRQGGTGGLALISVQARPVVIAWPPRAGSVTVRRVGSAGEVTVR